MIRTPHIDNIRKERLVFIVSECIRSHDREFVMDFYGGGNMVSLYLQWSTQLTSFCHLGLMA